MGYAIPFQQLNSLIIYIAILVKGLLSLPPNTIYAIKENHPKGQNLLLDYLKINQRLIITNDDYGLQTLTIYIYI